jgi:hypothetical protein
MPAEFMMLPAMMKNGTARRGKESTPFTMRWMTVITGVVISPVILPTTRNSREEPARATAIGTPRMIRTISATIMKATSMELPNRERGP